MAREPVKVLIVHAHERGEGSRIVAVCRANAQGKAIAESIRDASSPNTVDEVDIEEVAITEYVPLTNIARNVLGKLAKGVALSPGEFRTTEALQARGLVEFKQTAYGLTLNVTPAGLAALKGEDANGRP